MVRIFTFLLVFLASINGGCPVAQQQTAFVHDSGWTVGQSVPQTYLQPGQPATRPQPAPPASTPELDESWERVWGPIQDLTGVERGHVEGYVADVKDRTRDDTARVADNARAWAVIAADLGIGSFAKDIFSDLFGVAFTEVPHKLANE